MYKKIVSYLERHPVYNSSIHVIIGAGIGILITYPFVQTHPVRWGVALLVIGLLGHLYPLFIKK